MVLERLWTFFGGREEDDRAVYRCVNCGEEFERPHRECPACGGPFVAPVDEDGPNP